MLAKILLAAASVSAVTDDVTVAREVVTITDHTGHRTPDDCGEINGYVKNCEEGLSMLESYMIEETNAFTKARDSKIVTLG